MRKSISVTSMLLAMMAVSPAEIWKPETISAEAQAQVETAFFIPVEKPNQIVHGNVAYSGVFAQMVVSDKPFELINPLAPNSAGQAEDNTAYDLITSKSEGIKLFAISF